MIYFWDDWDDWDDIVGNEDVYDSFMPTDMQVDLPEGCVVVDKCDHQWIEYVGVLDAFEFCKLCDKKKEM